MQVKSTKAKGQRFIRSALFAFYFCLLPFIRLRRPRSSPSDLVRDRHRSGAGRLSARDCVSGDGRLVFHHRSHGPRAASRSRRKLPRRMAHAEVAHGKPVGVSVGPDGNVYVPDTHYHRVMVYSPNGEELRAMGERGTGPGQFIYPTDIAFDPTATSSSANTATTIASRSSTHDGKFLYQFGKFGNGHGEFIRPQSMVIDGDLHLRHRCVQSSPRRFQNRWHVRPQHGQGRLGTGRISLSLRPG